MGWVGFNSWQVQEWFLTQHFQTGCGAHPASPMHNRGSFPGDPRMCLHVKHRNLTWFTFQVRITAVDIDPAMLEVATQYFDLVQDERLDVYIRDGIQFIEQAAEKGLGICQFMCSSSNSTYCNYICKVPGLNPNWVQLSWNNPLLWFYICFSTFSRFSSHETALSNKIKPWIILL